MIHTTKATGPAHLPTAVGAGRELNILELNTGRRPVFFLNLQTKHNELEII